VRVDNGAVVGVDCSNERERRQQRRKYRYMFRRATERSVACYYCFVVEALIDNREDILSRGGVVGSTVVDGEKRREKCLFSFV
jgi:hypothetical protein